ncbi:MAG: selenium-dependent molybdenum cofactor biosynthesis protein YqeB, partial [Candidatus Korobacteraceae bacterium]
ASGVIMRLHRAGFRVLATETAQPTTVRRTVSFSEAVYRGEFVVEGIRARSIQHCQEASEVWSDGVIPVLVDPGSEVVRTLQPAVLVDAIMAKRNCGTRLGDAAVVIGLGPGFVAGVDVHAVVETNRGHHLGRVLFAGEAEPDTGVPGEIGGHAAARLLRAPCAGRLRAEKSIGDGVQPDEIVCWVDDTAVRARIAGVLRGLLYDGLPVQPGMKIGDIDPRATREHCFTISDKSLAVGGGVLEAVLCLLHQRRLASASGEHAKAGAAGNVRAMRKAAD